MGILWFDLLPDAPTTVEVRAPTADDWDAGQVTVTVVWSSADDTEWRWREDA